MARGTGDAVIQVSKIGGEKGSARQAVARQERKQWWRKAANAECGGHSEAEYAARQALQRAAVRAVLTVLPAVSAARNHCA